MRMGPINHFETIGDNEGTIYTVIEWQEVIETTTDEGTVPTSPGYLKKFTLLDGVSEVRFIDTETFKIVSTRETIRKVR